MTELDRLKQRMKDEGFSISGITPGPGLYDLPEEERLERLAREINRVMDEMKDPVKNLIARVEGKMFGLKDYIMCTEQRFDVVKNEHVPPTKEEQYKISTYREINSLFQECIDMIKQLNG